MGDGLRFVCLSCGYEDFLWVDIYSTMLRIVLVVSLLKAIGIVRYESRRMLLFGFHFAIFAIVCDNAVQRRA